VCVFVRTREKIRRHIKTRIRRGGRSEKTYEREFDTCSYTVSESRSTCFIIFFSHFPAFVIHGDGNNGIFPDRSTFRTDNAVTRIEDILKAIGFFNVILDCCATRITFIPKIETLTLPAPPSSYVVLRGRIIKNLKHLVYMMSNRLFFLYRRKTRYIILNIVLFELINR